MKIDKKFFKVSLLIVSYILTIILGFAIGNKASSPSINFSKSSNLIPLNSKEGEQMLNDSSQKQDYFPLSIYFVPQKKLSYCGVASITMILNALSIPVSNLYKPNEYNTFTQNNVLNEKTKKIVTNLKISFLGMTLKQMSKLLETYSVSSKVYYAESTTLDKFRKLAKINLEQSNNFVVVNYSRQILGQKGFGHISPLAAYNSKTDSFLILDVARYKYPPTWVKTEDLWQAMNTQDSESGKTRGFILAERKYSNPI